MSVILVGNGTSVLDEEYGDLIDSFDTVVRFNDFKIKGFEKHIGTKIDVWFTCWKFQLEEITKFNRVFLHTWEYNASSLIIAFQQALGGCKKTKFEITQKEEILKIPTLYPSTGLIAIHQLIKECGHVTIIGFDWWQEREKHHYGNEAVWGQGQSGGSLHKPKEEYKIIKKLESLQRLSFLTIPNE